MACAKQYILQYLQTRPQLDVKPKVRIIFSYTARLHFTPTCQ